MSAMSSLRIRGELVPGKRADDNLIDLENLKSGTLYMANDLPCENANISLFSPLETTT